QKRTNISSLRFRPWLQSFRDYAFDRRHFTGKEIREQIDASEKFGSHGWMLWNPRNSYSSAGLRRSARAGNLPVARNENNTAKDKRL
ncbi:MAG: putative glycoside hydrolase, partial [Thermodesulfovibrionales bacterium]